MKFFKKLLSGVMALTMAVSMAFSTAVQAGAETQKNGDHEFEVIWNGEYYFSVVGNMKFYQLLVGPFDNQELQEMKKEANKYEIGKSGFLLLLVMLHDIDKGDDYEYAFYFDKNTDWDENEFYYYSSYKNGIEISEDEYSCFGMGSFKNRNGKKYFALDFSNNESFAKKMSDCDAAEWAIFSSDNTGKSSKISIGNNNDCYWWADFTVEDQKDSKSEVKAIKHITADDAYYKYGNGKDEKAADISKLSFTKISDQSYTGKECKPSVTVKDGKTKLTEGKDYTLSYKNNKNIGTATVTVKGKGDYTGEKTISFNIVPKKTTLKVSKKSETKATFSWTAVKGAEKYEIYYSKDNGKTYKKLTTVAGSKTSYTNSKLDFKKYDYKFKIRSYGTSSSKKYYSSYSKVVTVK